LDASAFVWAKIVDATERERAIVEAQVQAGLLLPGVVPLLGHGAVEDGRMFFVFPSGGRPLDAGWIQKSSLADLLLLALEGTKILRALASMGFEIPDARLGRFLLERGGPHGLRLVELAGVEKRDPAAAAIAHGRLAVNLARTILTGEDGELRTDVPKAIKGRLRGALPIPILGKLLAEHATRASDGGI
jgi:hypothetical protein